MVLFSAPFNSYLMHEIPSLHYLDYCLCCYLNLPANTCVFFTPATKKSLGELLTILTPKSHPKPITLESSKVGPRWFQCVATVKSLALHLFSLKSILHTATKVFFLKLKLDYVWFPVQKSFNDFPLPLEKFFSVLYKPFLACYMRPFMIGPT